MKSEPIDYDAPLGISFKLWRRVLGVNLALVLGIYLIALVCTLSGNRFFMLNFENPALESMEKTLRGWGVFALVQIAFETVEATILAIFIARRRIKFWIPFALYGTFVLADVICTHTIGTYPAPVAFAITALFFIIIVLAYCRKDRKTLLFGFLRLGIGALVSVALNGLISLFRMNYARIWDREIGNSALFALNLEYHIALVLSLLLISLCLPLEAKKGADKQCPIAPVVGGSSPTSMNSSPKNSPSAKTNPSSLSPQAKKRIRLLRAKMFAIQSAAIIVTALLPWFFGKQVEFAIVYVSFCMTRLTLGFSRSLHFKSELTCIVVGSLMFLGLSFLTTLRDGTRPLQSRLWPPLYQVEV